LSARDAERLVLDTLHGAHDGHPGPRLVQRLVHLANGNPLLLAELSHELARALTSGPVDPEEDGQLPLPRSVQEMLTTRLAATDAAAQAVVAVVSLAPTALPVVELQQVAAAGVWPALSETSLDAAVDTAVRLRLVDEVEVPMAPGHARALTVHHPIFAVALRQELTLARRRPVHAALAAAVRHYRPTAVTTIAHQLDQADDPQARPWMLLYARQTAYLHA